MHTAALSFRDIDHMVFKAQTFKNFSLQSKSFTSMLEEQKKEDLQEIENPSHNTEPRAGIQCQGRG